MRLKYPAQFEEEERDYQHHVLDAQINRKYIKLSLSLDDIGCLLQEKHLIFPFHNNIGVIEGVIDIEMADLDSKFEVSEELNSLIGNIKF